MDYEFRKKLYELDEIGFIGRPNAKESKKDEYLISAWIQASKKMLKEQGRSLTEEEKNKTIQDAERAYNREVRQRRKAATYDKVASLTF
jgi:DNA-directed RNA polymerase beta' subunit